jgi:sec-independent protein translocase protein TatA
MPNIGPAELIIVLAIALVVFGPKKLPEIGKGIGNALREFNKARNDFMDSLNTEAEREEPARSVSASSSYSGSDDEYPAYAGEPAEGARQVEFPEPPAPDDVDALPYGGAFDTAGADSEPTYRTGDPDPDPALAAAPAAEPPKEA